VDAMDSTGSANTNHLLSFLDEDNNIVEENDDTNASHSSTIVGMCLVATYVIVVLFGFVTMRKELGQLCTRLFNTTRRNRTSRESGATSTLNDIIFDPEEEQRANLEESLLSSANE
jgi:hypothetical protein